MKVLLAAGADPDKATSDGETPCYTAAKMGHTEVVKVLLAAGADPHKANLVGFTPCLIALAEGHGDIVRLLNPKMVESGGVVLTAFFKEGQR